jgi:hypothetical protein
MEALDLARYGQQPELCGFFLAGVALEPAANCDPGKMTRLVAPKPARIKP